MASEQAGMSVLVWASVLEVEQYLAQITKLAGCLPGIDHAALADTPSRMILDRPSGPAVAGYQLYQSPGRVEWRIGEPVGYHGTIVVYGDVSLTQLRSTFSLATAPAGEGSSRVHAEFLRELAHRIEALHVGVDQPIPLSVV